MYVFLFEDSPRTPSSKLLVNSYNGKSIYFSDGNLLVRSKVEELLNEGCTKIILFLDVNPNNSNTISLLSHLSTIKYIDERWKDVVIVPIICIEFFIASICKKFGYFNEEQLQRSIVKYLVNTFDWNKMPNMVKSKSLEKIYKRLFEASGKCQFCLENRDGSGKFYLQDCNCEDCDLSKANLLLKAEQLYMSLPMFEVIDKEHEKVLHEFGIDFNAISLEELHNKQQEFYNDICLKMGKNRILINSIRKLEE